MVTERRTLKELAADLKAAQVEKPACEQAGGKGLGEIMAREETARIEMPAVIQEIESVAKGRL